MLNLVSTNIIFNILLIVSLILAISFQIGSIIAILNKSLDKSVGSLDNATGVAVLLEVAKLIKKNPLEKIDSLFLWCGAEEFGLWGSKQFLAKHFEELNDKYDLNKSIVINFDIIGRYIGLMDESGLIKKKKMNETLNNIIFAIAKQRNIELKKQKAIIGTGGDHMCFMKYAKKAGLSLQVTCFATNKDARYIHYPSDTPDRCSSKTLNDCIILCHETIRSIDKRLD
jgi:putative aminopeptidase FrvX